MKTIQIMNRRPKEIRAFYGDSRSDFGMQFLEMLKPPRGNYALGNGYKSLN